MSQAAKPATTIKDVALAARVSLATVSYALRNNPKIPEATRQHVQAVARKLGYRPNPRVASLMAHIRRAHARPTGERLAFVWVHTSRAQAERDPFLRNVYQGARRRAEQSGFVLEQFWTNENGMSDHRLQQIIQSRGILGVVLSPVMSHEASLTLDWDWDALAVAVIGNVTWTPELHHAGHHHYLGMRLALSELVKGGSKRPAALIEARTNERAKRAWEAAFLTHHPVRSSARSLVRVMLAEDATAAAAWLRAHRPDALVVSTMELVRPAIAAACTELGVPLATLYWDQNVPPDIGGVDQCYDRIAGHAVDLVVAQLNSNEMGVPDLPRIMLFPGRWIAPRVTASRSPGR